MGKFLRELFVSHTAAKESSSCPERESCRKHKGGDDDRGVDGDGRVDGGGGLDSKMLDVALRLRIWRLQKALNRLQSTIPSLRLDVKRYMANGVSKPSVAKYRGFHIPVFFETRFPGVRVDVMREI